jgi:hypothetical protein
MYSLRLIPSDDDRDGLVDMLTRDNVKLKLACGRVIEAGVDHC